LKNMRCIFKDAEVAMNQAKNGYLEHLSRGNTDIDSKFLEDLSFSFDIYYQLCFKLLSALHEVFMRIIHEIQSLENKCFEEIQSLQHQQIKEINSIQLQNYSNQHIKKERDYLKLFSKNKILSKRITDLKELLQTQKTNQEKNLKDLQDLQSKEIQPLYKKQIEELKEQQTKILDGVEEKYKIILSCIRKKEDQDLKQSQIIFSKLLLFNSKKELENFPEESILKEGYDLNEYIKPTVFTLCENYLGTIQITVDLQDWYPDIKISK